MARQEVGDRVTTAAQNCSSGLLKGLILDFFKTASGALLVKPGDGYFQPSRSLSRFIRHKVRGISANPRIWTSAKPLLDVEVHKD